MVGREVTKQLPLSEVEQRFASNALHLRETEEEGLVQVVGDEQQSVSLETLDDLDSSTQFNSVIVSSDVMRLRQQNKMNELVNWCVKKDKNLFIKSPTGFPPTADSPRYASWVVARRGD